MIILTRPAIAAIESALQREGKVGSGVRMSVTSGGCSGSTYGMTIESDPDPEDTIIEIRDVRLFVAADCMPLLAGVTIDHAPGGDGLGFIFESPNAISEIPDAAQGCACAKA
jgi:iron-sulfur cluster assembly protein